MSQTTGNYVGISEPPEEMYGKLMSIPDSLIEPYFAFLTDVDIEEAREEIARSPRDAKRRLAMEIVTIYHGAEAAGAARDEFDRIHVRHERPSEVERLELDRSLVKEDGTVWVVDLLAASGLVNSRGEAKRVIRQGGARVNGERIPSEILGEPIRIREEELVGRREGVDRAGVDALGAERAPRNVHPDLLLLREELDHIRRADADADLTADALLAVVGDLPA